MRYLNMSGTHWAVARSDVEISLGSYPIRCRKASNIPSMTPGGPVLQLEHWGEEGCRDGLVGSNGRLLGKRLV